MPATNKQLTLFLMSRKGLRVLEALSKQYLQLIDFVVTENDSNVEHDYCHEIRMLCKTLDIPCFTRCEKFDVKSNFAIAVSWQWLIHLQSTKLIVFHDSLLPKYRGFNPLVSYLLNGENEIGVTALFAAEDYDTGNIIAHSSSKVTYPLKIKDAIEIISQNYAQLSLKIVGALALNAKLDSHEQNESEATYSLWRDDADYRIDWNLAAPQIRRLIDAVGYPYKGAFTTVNGKIVRVLEAEELEDVVVENRAAGKVIFVRDSYPVVICGSGLLKIKSLIDDQSRESLLPLRRFRTRFI